MHRESEPVEGRLIAGLAGVVKSALVVVQIVTDSEETHVLLRIVLDHHDVR